MDEENIGEAIAKMGITFPEITAEHAVGIMPVEGNTQPFGILHGGAAALLAETVASFAAYKWAQRSGKSAVGAHLDITHIKPGLSGNIVCTVEAIHLGRRTAVYSFQNVSEDSGKIISAGVMSCAIVDHPEQ
ncbi:MAG: PaaI family thioesterase [Mobiluncus sp.]|uniref:PaaI family thioesterase n=1 Tax=Mobiluncus sp. TaxID=47293 RepID=UPI00258D5B20|nr:PaaI family thioesterase [Mobiluncus sp.]MCI6584389.1 PaaI family thioesterase [Mobiluncus sp.]